MGASDAPAVTLVTDGACSGNGTDDSRGGWAAILVDAAGEETVLTGGEFPSTNNRMELTAALEGLAAAPERSDVELVTDSSYVANALEQGWLNDWRRRGWRTAARKPVANRDLWERMVHELGRHERVRATLVRGHAGHPANERADRLAQDAALHAEPATALPAAEEQLGLDV